MIPEQTAWTTFEEAVDEQQFTPSAQPGWLAHNGQSPEVAVCDFVSKLIRMMQPKLVVETGVGQGYMTRTIVTALNGGHLVAFESDDEWRQMLWGQQFWVDRRFVAELSPLPTPLHSDFVSADLAILDSEFDHRFPEIRLWNEYARPGSVALIHDTADSDGTVHQMMRAFIGDLGMTGVFLNNPRGCFLAVQPKEKDAYHME